MRTFYLAAAVFLAILIFVISSSAISVGYARELIQIAEELPASRTESPWEASAATENLKILFESKRMFLHFVVGHAEIDSIENALLDLEAAQKSGDGYSYASARGRLISAIERIINSESLSLEAIF